MARIDWQTGYIGTERWRADVQAARAARQTERLTRRDVVTDGDMAGVPLSVVGCIGEAVETNETNETARPIGGESTARVARYAVGAFLTARMRDERRRAMQTARDVETARRRRLTDAQTAQTDGSLTDETAYVSPVADEWRGVPLRTLTALYSEGWRAAGDILTAFETAYAARRAATAGIEAVMLTEPDRDGRGTFVDPRQRWGVNATETRHTARWHGTPADAVTDGDGRPIDRTCWQYVPAATGIGPMQRVPFVPAVETVDTDETSTRRTSTATVDTAGSYAARLAAFGATGDVE